MVEKLHQEKKKTKKEKKKPITGQWRAGARAVFFLFLPFLVKIKISCLKKYHGAKVVSDGVIFPFMLSLFLGILPAELLHFKVDCLLLQQNGRNGVRGDRLKTLSTPAVLSEQN